MSTDDKSIAAGEQLMQMRESKPWGQSYVAMKTGIPTYIIQAVEDGYVANDDQLITILKNFYQHSRLIPHEPDDRVQ